MSREFKNFELLRYLISKKIHIRIEWLNDKIKSNSDSVAATVFSSFTSVFASSFLSEEISCFDFAQKALCLIVFFIISFCVGYMLYKYCIQKFFTFISRQLKKNPPSNDDIKFRKDDFDHIACDYILISNDFLQEFKKDSCTDVKTQIGAFYFFESIYYLHKAIKHTQNLFSKPDCCIKLPEGKDDQLNIDLFRISNIIALMSELHAELKDNIDKVCIEEKFKNDMEVKIEQNNIEIQHLRREATSLKDKFWK